MWALERCGWGAGTVDPEPPIRQPGAIERCRALALRAAVELLSDAQLGASLSPLFVSRDAPDDPEVALARLLGLLRRLIEQELPRLGRMLRCESAQTQAWQRVPAGGRVDALTSVRVALERTGVPAPDLWLVRRVERLADTPVNRLLASVLRDVEARLHRIAATDSAAGTLLGRERSLVWASLRALRGFFAASPLGSVPGARLTAEALLQASRRRAEMARFEGLLQWWRELQETELSALRAVAGEGAMRDLSPDASYELVCATSLVLALQARFPAEAGAEPGVFTFATPRGPLRTRFGAGSDRRFARRPWTAALSLPAGVEVVVEARNARAIAAAELAERLYLYCAARGARTIACLLTPAADVPADLEPQGQLRWTPFLTGLAAGEVTRPVAEWGMLLDALLSVGAKE